MIFIIITIVIVIIVAVVLFFVLKKPAAETGVLQDGVPDGSAAAAVAAAAAAAAAALPNGGDAGAGPVYTGPPTFGGYRRRGVALPTPTAGDAGAGPATGCTFTLHQGQGVAGAPADLTSFPAGSLDACKSGCCARADCKGFTYYSGACYLKPSHGSLVPLAGSVGGYRN